MLENEIMSGLTAPLDAVLTRLALHDLRCAYSHAADRCDESLLFSVFHIDAVIDVPGGGPVSRWILTIMTELRANYVTTLHVISNEYDEVSGDVAVAESYICQATCKTPPVSTPGTQPPCIAGERWNA